MSEDRFMRANAGSLTDAIVIQSRLAANAPVVLVGGAVSAEASASAFVSNTPCAMRARGWR